MKMKKKLLIKILFTPLFIYSVHSYAANNQIILNGKPADMTIDTNPISSSENGLSNSPDAIVIKGSDKGKPLNLNVNSNNPFTTVHSSGHKGNESSVPSNDDNSAFLPTKGAIILRGGNQAGSSPSNNHVIAKGTGDGMSISIGSAQNSPQNVIGGNQNQQNKKPQEIILKGGDSGNDLSNGRVLNFGAISSESNNTEEKTQEKKLKRDRIPVDFPVQENAIPNAPVIASGVPLPSSSVVPLPPLPGMASSSNLPPLPDMTGQIGVLHSQPLNTSDFNTNIESNGTGNPIDFSGKSVELPPSDNRTTQIESYWGGLFQQQADALMGAGAPLKIIIVDSKNFLLRKFILQGLLKGNDSYLSKMDTGLFPVMSQSTINGIVTPTCYVMFDQKNVETLAKEELVPLGKKTNDTQAAAFVTGHMVAHCLDQLERSKIIPLRSVWFSNDLAKYGVAGAASRRIFGNNGVDSQLYFTKQNELFKDLGQRQYEERGADIFGLLWALKQYNNSHIIDAVSQLRINQSSTSPHNTINAIRNVYTNYKTNLDTSLSGLWKETRKIQLETGINAQLSDGASLSLINSDPKPELSGAVNEKRHDYSYVVGSQYKSKNFNNLDRNGQNNVNMQDTKDFSETSQFIN